jgi:GGDEF domain-containing protein
LDLDGFKAVNDTHGHEVGDRALKALAWCLEEHLRQSDRAVRLGGRSSPCSYPRPAYPRPCAWPSACAGRWPPSRCPPVERLSASFGVAQAGPTDSPLSLLRRADEALYRAKRAGKNRVETA